MKRLSVRWRLTLWYGAVMTLIVIGFGTCVYWMMQHHLLTTTDFELDEELSELAIEVRLAQDQQELEGNLKARFFLRHPSFDFQVSDPQGEPLFRSERIAAVALPTPDLKMLQQASSAVFQLHKIQGLGETRVATRLASGTTGAFIVQASMPLAPNHRELHALLAMLLTAGTLAIGAALAGGYFLARQALAPVDRMATTAQQITAHRLSERIEVGNADDELGHLALTLNAMIERLQRAIEEMRQFTADAAHELRTPLSVLQTEAEVALRMTRSAEEYREVVTTTLRESQRLSRLADQLLVLCRHDSGLQPTRHEEVPLSALLVDVVDQLRIVASQKEIAVEITPLGNWVVDGDDIQLSQLLFNLLDNAIKFTPPQGRVRVSGESSDGYVALVIADTGIGVSADDLPHLFDRFFRADRSRNGNVHGTGLGLAICKAIVDAHKGTISVESSPGNGTRVRVRLPLTESEASPEPA